MSVRIDIGDQVEVQTSGGDWRVARVVEPASDAHGTIPKLWVAFPDDDRKWPWPIESIRPVWAGNGARMQEVRR